MESISIVVLAAGKSKRMNSSRSKVLHSIAYRPIINYVHDLAKKYSTAGIFYVCSNEVENYIKNNFFETKTIIQKKPLGTAHAVECISGLIPKINNDVIVLFGDVPLLKNSTIKKLIYYKRQRKSIGSIITFLTNKPYGYGRVITDKNYVKCIIEEKDTTSQQRNIRLCNSGILICDAKYLFSRIKKITSNNKQKERFLTDICEIAYKENKPFSFYNCNENEVSGINSRKQLIDLDLKFQKIIKDKLINKGVTLIQPDSISISYDSKIEKDVIIEPNTIIKNGVKIKKFTKILSGSYLEGCKIGKHCSIGPYARIRPNTKLSDNIKIGNFVEIKNSSIGSYSSIAHLSYIGDSKIGKKVNIGAGTITCNYDGVKKHRTIIGDNSFIGSNSSLIAPIKINNNATIGAGSVITKNVPTSSLAIERSKLLILKKVKNKKNS